VARSQTQGGSQREERRFFRSTTSCNSKTPRIRRTASTQTCARSICCASYFFVSECFLNANSNASFSYFHSFSFCFCTAVPTTTATTTTTTHTTTNPYRHHCARFCEWPVDVSLPVARLQRHAMVARNNIDYSTSSLVSLFAAGVSDTERQQNVVKLNGKPFFLIGKPFLFLHPNDGPDSTKLRAFVEYLKSSRTIETKPQAGANGNPAQQPVKHLDAVAVSFSKYLRFDQITSADQHEWFTELRNHVKRVLLVFCVKSTCAHSKPRCASLTGENATIHATLDRAPLYIPNPP
jgi:hypothetical protein